MELNWAYSLAGIVVGFIVGVTGMGGGSLMTPLLILLFGVAPNLAIGTDLLFAALTKSWGVWIHNAKRHVEWRIVGLLAAGSIPAAIVSVLVLQTWGDSHISKQAMTTALGVALLLTGPAVLFKTQILTLAHARLRLSRYTSWRPAATVVTGALLGIMVTFSSVGAGVLGTMALFFLYPWQPAVKIVGTDIAHAVPLTAVAGLGHLHMGNVDFTLLAYLLAGSLPGIWLGSHMSSKIPDRILRPVLGGVLMVFGAKFVMA